MKNFIKNLIRNFHKEKVKKHNIDNENKQVCVAPFSYVEISDEGEVFPCCVTWESPYYYSFGNILKTDFERIWTGKKAEEFRKSILNGSYKYCNTKYCNHFYKISAEEIKKLYYDKNNKIKLPIITMCFDRECNVACITCRNHLIRNDKSTMLKLKKDFYRNLKPVIPKLEKVSFAGMGDPFGSRFYGDLIKQIASTNTKAKFKIHTNGSLMTKEKIITLGIYNRIYELGISVHATTEDTYNKMVKYSNFKKVMENIEWISKDDIFNTIELKRLVFVITHLNYKEIPDFIKLAEKYGFDPFFIPYKQWYPCEDFPADVWEQHNNLYEDFKNVINNISNKYFEQYPNAFPPVILNLRNK